MILVMLPSWTNGDVFSTFVTPGASSLSQLMYRRWMAWECDWSLSRSREWTNSPQTIGWKLPKVIRCARSPILPSGYRECCLLS